jgi:polysaccharide pyruvyl transferase WcaK-like protein
MKVLFVNDSTSSSNWGDRAAAVALMHLVRECGGEIVFKVTEKNLWDAWFGDDASCDLDVAASPSPGRKLARHYLPPAVLAVRRQILARRDGVGQDQHALIPAAWGAYEAFATRVCREGRCGWPDLVQAMGGADVMVIHGASLHGELYVARAMLFLAYLMKVRFGKPVVLANHTSGLEGELLRTADHVYPLFDDVVYRDQLSAERWAPVYGGRFAADSAFLFEPAERSAWAALAARPTYFDVWPDTAAFDPSEPYLCVGGSAIFHDRKDWNSLVAGYAALIAELRAVYEGTIVLTASAELDEPVLRTLAARYDLPLVGVRTPVQQAVDIVGNADVYVGGRWHPGIFALRGGTPLVPLSSQTVKMQALARQAEAPEPFDTLHLESAAPAIALAVSRALAQGDALRAGLAEKGRELAANSCDNVAYLTSMPGGLTPQRAAQPSPATPIAHASA